jgi:GNAT superfamily N-acetyltransferase
VIVRPMRADDVAAVAALTTQLGYPTSPAEIAERFAALVDRDDEAVLLAVDEEVPTGYLHVGVERSLAASAVAGIHGRVGDERRRSDGIGRRLLEAAEAWARERGCRRMTVRSRTTRAGAHRFYERAGYRLIKESRVYGREL